MLYGILFSGNFSVTKHRRRLSDHSSWCDFFLHAVATLLGRRVLSPSFAMTTANVRDSNKKTGRVLIDGALRLVEVGALNCGERGSETLPFIIGGD